MQMRMKVEVLTPGMKNSQKPDGRAQAFGISRNGEYSCIAVRGAATVAEIRERVRMHREGQRHTLADDPAAPAGRVRLRRA